MPPPPPNVNVDIVLYRVAPDEIKKRPITRDGLHTGPSNIESGGAGGVLVRYASSWAGVFFALTGIRLSMFMFRYGKKSLL